MQSKNTFLAYLGLLLIIAGGLLWAIRLQADAFSIVPLALGGVAILAWAAQNMAFITQKITGRTAMEGANMAVSVIVFLAISIFLYLLLSRHSVKFDFTEAQKFTLATQSVQLAKSLEDEVLFRYLVNPNTPPGEQARVKDLVGLYEHQTGNIVFEIVDPEREPQKVQDLAPVTLGSLYVLYGDSKEKVDPVNEENLTNALMKVTKGASRIVYFTTGHDEPSIEDAQSRDGLAGMKEMLEDEGFTVQELALFEQEDVPEDAAALVVAGPQRPFLETEIDAIKLYLEAGGDALFFLDPETNSGLEPFIEENYGVALGDNYVVENNPLMRMFGGSPIAPTMSQLEGHPITDAYQGQAQAISFFKTRSVAAADSIPDDVEVTELIKTSPNSWAETDVERLFDPNDGTAGYDEGEDIMGPISIAAAIEKELEAPEGDDAADDMSDDASSDEAADEESADENVEVKDETPAMRLVVFGDSDFIRNRNYLSGLDLFLNSVNWLVQQEDLISIRAKDDSGQPVMLSPVQVNTVFYLSIIVLPLLVAILGGAVVVLKRMRG